jgi:hypothetical protein
LVLEAGILGTPGSVAQPFAKEMGLFSIRCQLSGLISAAWISMLPIHGRGSSLPVVYALLEKCWRFEWPWSQVYHIAFVTAFEATIVAFALDAYLAFFRIWNPRKILQAFDPPHCRASDQ